MLGEAIPAWEIVLRTAAIYAAIRIGLRLAGPLDVMPLPMLFLLAISGIVVACLASAELAKRWVYRHYGM